MFHFANSLLLTLHFPTLWHLASLDTHNLAKWEPTQTTVSRKMTSFIERRCKGRGLWPIYTPLRYRASFDGPPSSHSYQPLSNRNYSTYAQQLVTVFTSFTFALRHLLRNILSCIKHECSIYTCYRSISNNYSQHHYLDNYSIRHDILHCSQ